MIFVKLLTLSEQLYNWRKDRKLIVGWSWYVDFVNFTMQIYSVNWYKRFAFDSSIKTNKQFKVHVKAFWFVTDVHQLFQFQVTLACSSHKQNKAIPKHETVKLFVFIYQSSIIDQKNIRKYIFKIISVKIIY